MFLIYRLLEYIITIAVSKEIYDVINNQIILGRLYRDIICDIGGIVLGISKFNNILII